MALAVQLGMVRRVQLVVHLGEPRCYQVVKEGQRWVHWYDADVGEGVGQGVGLVWWVVMGQPNRRSHVKWMSEGRPNRRCP